MLHDLGRDGGGAPSHLREDVLHPLAVNLPELVHGVMLLDAHAHELRHHSTRPDRDQHCDGLINHAADGFEWIPDLNKYEINPATF